MFSDDLPPGAQGVHLNTQYMVDERSVEGIGVSRQACLIVMGGPHPRG